MLGVDAVLVAGTDSALIIGRKAQLLAWKSEFAAPRRTIYTRTPDSILVSAVEPIALEQGDWQGVAVGDERKLACGRYTAKWRHLADRWFIEAEIYLTLG